METITGMSTWDIAMLLMVSFLGLYAIIGFITELFKDKNRDVKIKARSFYLLVLAFCLLLINAMINK